MNQNKHKNQTNKKYSTKMRLRKGSPMEVDLATLWALFGIVILLFLVVMVLNKYVDPNGQDQQLIEFVENVCLGALASALISYVTIFVPYWRTRKKNGVFFDKQLRNIYMQYEMLCAHSQSDINIRMYVKLFEKEIKDFKVNYDSLDFTSDRFEAEAKVVIEEWTLLPVEINCYIDVVDRLFSQRQYDDDNGKLMTREVNKILHQCILSYIKPLELFPKEFSISEGSKILCGNRKEPNPCVKQMEIFNRVAEKEIEIETLLK